MKIIAKYDALKIILDQCFDSMMNVEWYHDCVKHVIPDSNSQYMTLFAVCAFTNLTIQKS